MGVRVDRKKFSDSINLNNMKNEAVIQKLKELGWDTVTAVTITIALERWALVESTRYEGEWEGNGFVTNAQTNWKIAELEAPMSGEDVIFLLNEYELGELSSDCFGEIYLVHAEDGNMDCMDTEWESPLSEEDEEKLNDSGEDVFSLSTKEEFDWDFEVGSVRRLSIRVGNEEIDIEL
jgi:hypothetical protein